MPSASKHFELEPLSSGIYAAIARPTGLAGANAGVIDLGGQTLLFDTCLSLQAATDLIDAAQRLTGNPVTLAINSHWHIEHVGGNHALPATATVISTPRTRELIAERIPPLIKDYRAQIPQRLKDLEVQLQTENDPDKLRRIGEQIDQHRMSIHDLPNMAARVPTITFDGMLMFQGTDRRAELLTFGGGHTDSDALLYLPDECILFAGDLLFNGVHPFLGNGHPDTWLRIYDKLDSLDPHCEVVVPGHGPVTTPDAFAALRRYIPALRKLVTAIQQNRGTADDAAVRAIPAAFSDWGMTEHFPQNMRFLFEQAQARTG